MDRNGVKLVSKPQIEDRWDTRRRDLRRRWLHKGKSYWERVRLEGVLQSFTRRGVVARKVRMEYK